MSGVIRRAALAACLLPAAGCGAEEHARMESTTAVAVPAASPSADASLAREAPPAAGEKGTSAATVPPAIPRKIIYNAQITLVVESVAALGERLTALVKDAGGYISQTDQSSYTQAQANASWTVRVPVERFDTVMAAVSRLGEAQKTHVDSQDVTQEFYDIEARIANKQQEEKRLQKHLDDSTGKLEDILTVERELSRVRGEIEAMQGRIRYLANVSAMSTLTITATEVRDYVPPVEPTFAAKVARTFAQSVENLVEFAQGIALIAVAIAPWIPVLFLAALPFLIVWRRNRAARRREVTFVRPEPGAG